MVNKINYSEYEKFAKKLILEAGKILLKNKKTVKIIKSKKDALDVVTNIDYQVEKFIWDSLKKRYPTHLILSEETLDTQTNASDYQWVLDPIDGTKEYLRNIPLYCTILSLEHKNQQIVGLTYQPEIKRLYSAVITQGSYLNNQPINVSKETNLDKSMVYIRLPTSYMKNAYLDWYLSLFKVIVKNAYRIRNSIWDIEAMCFVALGAGEGYILPTSKDWCPPHWWDVSAGIIIVEEAGGIVTDFYGNKIKNHDLSNGLVASNGLIHEKLLNLIKKTLSS